MSFNKKLEKVRKVVRLHMNWLIATILGDDVLSKEERDELKSFKLSKDSISLTEKAFILGRVKALLKKSDWKNFTWEDLQDKSASLSPLEKLAVNAAKQKAATHIRGLTNDIATGVFTALQQAQASTVTEASLKQIIADEVALGLLEKKNYKQVASSIAEKTKTAHSDRWEMISRTELHSAKIQGTAQAIINKVDIYQHSDGPDSRVSIIPNPGTCPDCANHFLDSNGTPLVFTLKELLDAGSNADPGTNHSKKNNIHTHWKTTLPPLHPSCRCQLVYIPPGYSWVGTKLTLTDSDALMKAIGDSKLSATIKPPGPPTKSGPATPATIPGVKSPAQGSKSPTASTKVDTPSAGPQMSPCPFGGGDSCRKHGGNGAKTHEAGGAIMKAHQEALAAGATPDDPQAAEQLRQETVTNAIEWGKQEHPHATALAHLSKGKIVNKEALSGEESGQSLAYRVSIEGNGRGLMKPVSKNVQSLSDENLETGACLCGEMTTLPGTAHHREEGAYNLHMAMGLTDHVPPTTTRHEEGTATSMQAWKEGYKPLSSLRTGEKNVVKATLAAAGKNADKVRAKLEEGAVMQLVMNHNDGHDGNILISEDGSDVQFIDHGATFGHAMYGGCSIVHSHMHSAGMKLKVPEPLMDKFSKTSYGSIKRTLAKQSPSEQAHTFLRMRYIQHLQETEGHLDYEKFTANTVFQDGVARPRAGFSEGDLAQQYKDFAKKGATGKTPAQLYERFAVDYLKKTLTDPEHADHGCVSSLLQDNPDIEELFEAPDSYIETKIKPHMEYSAPTFKKPASDSPRKKPRMRAVGSSEAARPASDNTTPATVDVLAKPKQQHQDALDTLTDKQDDLDAMFGSTLEQRQTDTPGTKAQRPKVKKSLWVSLDAGKFEDRFKV